MGTFRNHDQPCSPTSTHRLHFCCTFNCCYPRTPIQGNQPSGSPAALQQRYEESRQGRKQESWRRNIGCRNRANGQVLGSSRIHQGSWSKRIEEIPRSRAHPWYYLLRCEDTSSENPSNISAISFLLMLGRVAMLGVLGFLTQEAFHPLFGGDIGGPAVKQFGAITRMAPTFWYPVLLAIAVAELGRARIGWQDPTSGGSMFSLRDGYEPGNLGFDPLNLKPGNPTELANMKYKELNNGRLAMLALAGFMAQELVNGKPIVDNLQG